MVKSSRIKILGAGPTGTLLAIALAEVGSTVNIYDPKNEYELINRSRSYALTQSTRMLLQRLNLWQKIIPILNPFQRLLVIDDETYNQIDFTCLDLPKDQIPIEDIGWIVDHNEIMRILLDHIKNHDNISIKFGSLSNSDNNSYELILAADGPSSQTRNELGIKSFAWKYEQACLTAKILLRSASPSTAYEVFRSEGPLAILPMGDNIFQIVWSAPFDLCNYRAQLKPSAFLDRLAAVIPAPLEPDLLLDSPSVYPIRLSIASKLYKGNCILVGESAHCCHPVGGQGLNLCLRDVDVLMRLIRKVNHKSVHVSSIPILYTKNRYIDVFTVCFFTDVLIRFFSNRSFPFVSVRSFALIILKYFSFLRRNSLGLMTYGPEYLFKLYLNKITKIKT